MYTTSTATASRIHRLPSELWNALAAPWKFVLIVSGSVRFATSWIFDTASPRVCPGFRPNEMVTAGSCP